MQAILLHFNLTRYPTVMRYLLLLSFLVLGHLPASAQTAPVKRKPTPKQQAPVKQQSPKVYTYVEQPASFLTEGGVPALEAKAREALYAYLADNFKDKEALAAIPEYTTALFTLTINPAGELVEVKTLKSISPAIDQEFIRVFKSVPAWVPAEHNGVKVHSILNVPVKVYPSSYDKNFKQIQEYQYYVAVEHMPSYKGGAEELLKALQLRFKNIPRPLVKDPAKPLILAFNLNTDGTVLKGNTKIFNGHSRKTNELLASLVEKLPAFHPGIQGEREVIMHVAIPVGVDDKGNIAWVYSPPKN
ncbi:hypothetical protein [Rufibacter sp. DG15C]|uniref:hypothetical protein n=1 Tax=Rufibacter sp. DG15C TaxID=1379909 RepID=UPI0012FCC303|nr:hypothetical protein [Rufibacter sp. DG15C]